MVISVLKASGAQQLVPRSGTIPRAAYIIAGHHSPCFGEGVHRRGAVVGPLDGWYLSIRVQFVTGLP
jgi:hypothetical protein